MARGHIKWAQAWRNFISSLHWYRSISPSQLCPVPPSLTHWRINHCGDESFSSHNSHCTFDVGATKAADKWAVSSSGSNFFFKSFFRSYQLKIQFLSVQRRQESPGFTRKAVPGVAFSGHADVTALALTLWDTEKWAVTVGWYKPVTREIWLQFWSRHLLAVSSFSKWLQFSLIWCLYM